MLADRKFALVAFFGLSVLTTVFGQAPSAARPSARRSVWDGVYSVEQAERGGSLYNKECASCHEGGEEAPSLQGATFVATWNGQSVDDLFENIRHNMPPNDPGHLSKQQYADVVTHIFSVNKFPVGKAELPVEAEVMKNIQILQYAPSGRKN